MTPSQFLGKMFLIFGCIILIIGLILYLNIKIPYLGRLPGDIYIKKENFSFYFPITTCIILSILLSLLLRIFFK